MLVLQKCPLQGRRLNSPLWISCLLLSDSCISGHGLSEFWSFPLEHLCSFQAWSQCAFHKHVLSLSSKASIKTWARPRSEASLCRFWSEASLTTLHAVFPPYLFLWPGAISWAFWAQSINSMNSPRSMDLSMDPVVQSQPFKDVSTLLEV